MQIEEQKIDHVTVEKTVGQISHDAGEEQAERKSRQVSGERRRRSNETNNQSATQERTMKKRLLFLNDPKAAPVLVTKTRVKKSGMTIGLGPPDGRGRAQTIS